MEKLVYLLRGSEDSPAARLRAALIDDAATQLRPAGASAIAVNVHDEDVAQGKAVRIAVQSPPIRAMVSFWMASADDRGACEETLRRHAQALDGYLVAESVPMANREHAVPRGERTPGVSMVTCINRLPALSYEEFIDRWHRDHKKVAVETQSTFAYVRNVVVRRLTEEAPPRDGIVEEAFPIAALTDPKIWYVADSDAALQRNLKRMIDSVQRFLDLGPLESHPMSQYLLP